MTVVRIRSGRVSNGDDEEGCGVADLSRACSGGRNGRIRWASDVVIADHRGGTGDVAMILWQGFCDRLQVLYTVRVTNREVVCGSGGLTSHPSGARDCEQLRVSAGFVARRQDVLAAAC